MGEWLDAWLVTISMALAILASVVPVQFFDASEVVQTRTEDEPPRRWLGLALGVGVGLPAMVGFDAWLHETLRSGPPGVTVSFFLGMATLGVGLGGSISGWCSYSTGGRWIPGKTYHHHDPVRGRRVGLVRAAIGVVILTLVAISV